MKKERKKASKIPISPERNSKKRMNESLRWTPQSIWWCWRSRIMKQLNLPSKRRKLPSIMEIWKILMDRKWSCAVSNKTDGRLHWFLYASTYIFYIMLTSIIIKCQTKRANSSSSKLVFAARSYDFLLSI